MGRILGMRRLKEQGFFDNLEKAFGVLEDRIISLEEKLGMFDRDWEAYKKWLETKAVCIECGARYSERERDKNGVCITPWVTETLCTDCYRKPDRMQPSGSTHCDCALCLNSSPMMEFTYTIPPEENEND